MKELNRYIAMLFSFCLIWSYTYAQKNSAQTHMFQLSLPVVEVDSLIFTNSSIITVAKGESGSEIFYKNGDNSMPYEKPILVTESSKLSFWAEHLDFATSDTLHVNLVKARKNLCDVRLTISPMANENYRAQGVKSLTDLKKGSTNFRSGKEWLGFNSNLVKITLELDMPTKLSKIRLGVLREHGSWIFLPKSVHAMQDKSVLASVELPVPEHTEKSLSTFISLDLIPKEYSVLELYIAGLDEIPEWHPGKGTIPWIFIDEILIEP